MHTTNLRKVGGSVMVAVPPAMLEQLHLKARGNRRIGRRRRELDTQTASQTALYVG